MSRRLVAVLVLAAAMAGCETTGNPREGGLWGWSEEKAVTRRQEKLGKLSQAERERDAQQARSAALQSHETQTEAEIDTTRSRNRAASAAADDLGTQVHAKAVKLEKDCFTPATASSARRLRVSVESVAASPVLTPEQRIARLHTLDAKLDAARQQFGL